jgi:hypothetical protein
MNTRRRYTQTITYWPPTSENDWGEEGFEAPQTIDGRWENRQERAVTPSGEEIISKAFVYSEATLAIGGYVVLGSSVATNPIGVEGAEQIKGNTWVPSLRTNTEVKAAIL